MPFNIKHVFYLLLYIATGSANSLLVKRSQTRDVHGNSHYAYEPVTVTLSVTLFKLTVTAIYVFFFLYPSQSLSKTFLSLIRKTRVARSFLIPACLYFGFDVLAFYNLQLVQPSTFRLLINLKVLFSGILLNLIIGIKLSFRQWVALIVLVAACGIEQIDSFDPNTGIIAIMFISLQALCSSSAGVYFQYLLQSNSSSSSTSSHENSSSLGLWEKNLFLYFWTLLFNLIYLAILAPKVLWQPMEALNKFDANVIPIIITSGIGGFSTSLILRDMDVIVKEYANFAEMCVVVVGAAIVLGSPIHLTLIVAVAMVTLSLYLYNVPPASTILSPSNTAGNISINERKLVVDSGAHNRKLSASHLPRSSSRNDFLNGNSQLDSVTSGGEEAEHDGEIDVENVPLITKNSQNSTPTSIV